METTVIIPIHCSYFPNNLQMWRKSAAGHPIFNTEEPLRYNSKNTDVMGRDDYDKPQDRLQRFNRFAYRIKQWFHVTNTYLSGFAIPPA